MSTNVALAFFTLVGLASRLHRRAPRPVQWANLSAVGAVSYGLLVIHVPFLFAAKAWFPGSWTAVLFALPVSFAAAAVLEDALQPRIRAQECPG
jgi:peptidoglycan/LPS O-acetylase OafA/YrhL